MSDAHFYMSMDDVAKHLKTSRKTLRTIENEGLIDPEKDFAKEGKGIRAKRKYSPEDVDRIKFILNLRERLQTTLEVTRKLKDLKIDAGSDPLDEYLLDVKHLTWVKKPGK